MEKGNTNEKKEKTKTERKNEKGKRSYDFQGKKIEEEKIKRRQNEKQVYKRERKI